MPTVAPNVERALPDAVEVAIIGAGPAGLAAAVQAAARGVPHALLERSRPADTVQRYQKKKWVMDEPPALDLQPDLGMRFEAASREDVLARWEEDFTRSGAEIFAGPEFEVQTVEGSVGAFALRLKDGRTLRASRVVLAIGVQGNRRTFGVPGDTLPHVTYQLDDPADWVDRHIVVVGVGDAGLENALALVEHGNHVTVVNRRAEMDRANPRNRTLVEAAIKSGAINYYTNSVTERFEEGAILLRTNEGEVRLRADLVIGRLGAIPPRRLLESFGVVFPSDDAAAVPEVSDSYECNVPGIHLIGALGGYPLIKNCMNQGFEVVEHILGHPVKPADEPALARKFEGIQGSVSEILERIRHRIPLFGGLTRIQLRELIFDSDIQRLAAGETVFRRNEFTNTFFSILEGRVEIEVPASDRDADLDEGDVHRTRRFEVAAGEFCGEQGLISGRRRTGTAIALADTLLIASRRLVVNKLIRSVDEARRQIDRVSIERTLGALVPNAAPEDLRRAAENARVKTFQAGEVLFREGEEPDGIHLVRRGAVTVSVMIEGRDAVIQYVQAGQYVGETAFIETGRVRSATITATALTETVLLPSPAIRRLLERSPELRAEFYRRESDQVITSPVRSADRHRSLVMFLLEQGAHEATDLLLIDESLCIRCDNCETACAATHGGVTRLDREAGPTYTDNRGVQLHIPTACQHCEHPKCMDECPPDAIRRHPNGEVYIMDNCIGCGACVTNCPYDVIRLAKVDATEQPSLLMQLLYGAKPRASRREDGEADAAIAAKCDLCRHYPVPRSGGPRAACVAACPTGAIIRVDPREFVDEIYRGQS